LSKATLTNWELTKWDIVNVRIDQVERVTHLVFSEYISLSTVYPFSVESIYVWHVLVQLL